MLSSHARLTPTDGGGAERLDASGRVTSGARGGSWGNCFRGSCSVALEKLAVETGESEKTSRGKLLGPWPLTLTSHLLKCLSPLSWRTCCGTDSSWGPSSSSSVCWPSLYPFPSPQRRSPRSPGTWRCRGGPRPWCLLQARGPRRRPRRSARAGG